MIKNYNLLEILNKWNAWNGDQIHRSLHYSGEKRDILTSILPYLEEPFVITLIGIRRCGKSTIFHQLIQALLQSGKKSHQILYLNFEEPSLSDSQDSSILDQVWKVYRENINPKDFPYLFLDEIQNVPGWEKWVRVKNELREAKIFITGSSAKLLSSELGSALTGRHISFTIWPLSFREFLQFKKISIRDHNDYLNQKTIVRNLLKEYFHFGGLPEIILTEEVEKKETILKQYFEDTLFRDIVARHEVRDVQTLRRLGIQYLTHISSLSSYTRLKNIYGIPLDVVKNYTVYLMECFLIGDLMRFSYKVREQQVSNKKYYATDVGIRNAISFRFIEDLGPLAENLVYNELRRRGSELYYASEKNEIDFVVKKGMNLTEAIQVSYSDLQEPQVWKREVEGFQKEFSLLTSHSIQEGLLITDDFEDKIEQKGFSITCQPLVKFLLGI